jgi:hypothetical protein
MHWNHASSDGIPSNTLEYYVASSLPNLRKPQALQSADGFRP